MGKRFTEGIAFDGTAILDNGKPITITEILKNLNRLDKVESELKKLRVTDVSGSISITKGRTERYRAVYSNSKWFDECEWYSIRDNGEYLTITKCLGIEIPKNAQKFPKTKHFQFTSELPIGKFEFDEDESDKDTLVIYYR